MLLYRLAVVGLLAVVCALLALRGHRQVVVRPVIVPIPIVVQAAAPGGGTGDRDGDGIPDVRDRCPDDPEDMDGFQDDDGCPDPDNDQDGIPDSVDMCPNQPETVNGYQDTDGCPDVAP